MFIALESKRFSSWKYIKWIHGTFWKRKVVEWGLHFNFQWKKVFDQKPGIVYLVDL